MKRQPIPIIVITTAGLILTLGASPMKTALFTPALQVEKAGTSVLYCHVVNISGAPRSGTIEIVRGDGATLSSASFTSLPPKGVTSDDASFADTDASVGPAYCKITVEGSGSNIRGSLVLVDRSRNTTTVVEAH